MGLNISMGGKRGQAFDLGVTNILQGRKKLGTAEQPTRPPSSGRESRRVNCPILARSDTLAHDFVSAIYQFMRFKAKRDGKAV